MYIYGKNVCKEKLLASDKINKAYISNKFNDREIMNLIKKNNVKYTLCDNKMLDSKVKGLHQGIILDID